MLSSPSVTGHPSASTKANESEPLPKSQSLRLAWFVLAIEALLSVWQTFASQGKIDDDQGRHLEGTTDNG
jgi:hypothetical protein